MSFCSVCAFLCFARHTFSAVSPVVLNHDFFAANTPVCVFVQFLKAIISFALRAVPLPFAWFLLRCLKYAMFNDVVNITFPFTRSTLPCVFVTHDRNAFVQELSVDI